MVEGGEAHGDQVGTGLVLLEGSATGGSERVPTGQDSAVDDARPARGPEIGSARPGTGQTAAMDVRRLVIGGVLVALGVLVGVAGLVWAFRGFFAMDATLAADGRPHEVAVGSGEHVVWVPVGAGAAATSCTAEAAGTALELRPVGGTFSRSGGSGSWEAAAWFDAPGDVVTLTCTAAEPDSDQEVEIGPRIAGLGLVGRILATVGLAAVLVLSGGVLLLVTVVRGLAAQGRPATT